MSTPTYLAKNRHGAFIFRIKVPVYLRHLFAGKKAITKSLKTYHRPTALKLARRYATVADDLFYRLEMKSKYEFDKIKLKAHRSVARAQLHDLKDNLPPKAFRLPGEPGDETSTELDSFIEEATPINEKILNLDAALKTLGRKIEIAEEHELRQQVLKDYGVTQSQALNKATPTLSEAMLLYIKNKEKEGSAKKAHPEKAIHKGPAESPYRGYTASFRLLLAAAGNIKTAELSLPQITNFKAIIGEMKNANHRAVKPLLKFDYESHKFIKPIQEILEELAHIDAPKLAQKTIEEYYSEISIFIGWLGLENEYLAVDTCHRLQKALSPLKVPKHSGHAKETSYKQFSIHQLQKLLTHPKINPNVPYMKSPRSKQLTPADFWIPLLALFTGARGRELAQLFTEDIREETGIWCISIKPEEDTDGTHGKEVKTESSTRLIPIHQKLIDIGILKFHQEQKLNGEKLLFPQLRETVTGRSNPYKSWGQDFRRDILQKHIEIPAGSGEVFHSFRGTLITELERQGVAEGPRKQLAGHSKGWDAHSRYSGGETLKNLQTLLNKATFDGLDFTGINWEKYSAMRLI